MNTCEYLLTLNAIHAIIEKIARMGVRKSMNEQWYTVQQAAEILQCSVSTVRRRIADGELKVMKSGRIIRISADAIKDMMQGKGADDQKDGTA